MIYAYKTQDIASCKTLHSQKDQKLVFKTNYRLLQVKNIAGAFCNTFDFH